MTQEQLEKANEIHDSIEELEDELRKWYQAKDFYNGDGGIFFLTNNKDEDGEHEKMIVGVRSICFEELRNTAITTICQKLEHLKNEFEAI